MNSPLLFCYFMSGLIGFFIMFGGVHKIYEGNIGVYIRGGALLPTYTEPGVHFMIPIVTKYHNVQVTLQTDKVTNIPCGTSSGVMIYFDKIEVVNRLKKSHAFQTIKNYTIHYDNTWIFDKIHHEINQFCSSHSLHEVYVSQFDQLDENLQEALQRGCSQWAPGIEIIAVRVTKPGIPHHILENYEKMEREKTKLLILQESQKVRAKEGETEKALQRISAETGSAVAQIDMEEQILHKEGRQKLEQIQSKKREVSWINTDIDEISLLRERSLAESENYRKIKEIEINKKKLTKEYILYTAAQSIKKANKHYYGESIPKYLETNIDLLKSKHSKDEPRTVANEPNKAQSEKEEYLKRLDESSRLTTNQGNLNNQANVRI